MVPEARFESYYGKSVINPPVWEKPDIPGYLFLGGLAGAASLLAAGAQLTGRPGLERGCKVGAFGAVTLSLAALVHDLGRPARFLNMLRVFKPTSPMSVGSWTLGAYTPAAGLAAFTAVTGRLRWLGAAGTAGTVALGPLVASYTAALVANTAVPAWHDGYRELPFVFVGSSATAAGGLGLVVAPLDEAGPARALALFGAATELVNAHRMQRRLGMVAEPYKRGPGGWWMRVGKLLSLVGVATALTRGDREGTTAAGALLLAASAATRWGIVDAGYTSACEPKYTVVPQRDRLTKGRAS